MRACGWLCRCRGRYQSSAPVPDAVQESMFTETEMSPGFSIKGAASAGMPIYLDAQVT